MMTRTRASASALCAFSVFLGCWGALIPSAAHAQEGRAMSGTVTFEAEPVPSAPVELHRVTRSGGGPVATARTGRDGAFRLEYDAAADPGDFVVHFATTTFRGVRYFGPVIHGDQDADELRIEVFDTVSVHGAEPVDVPRRDVVVVPHPADGWEINELIRLRNSGDRTIVSSDGDPIWAQALPEGAREVQVGDGELSEGVRMMNGRVLLTDPVLPGDREVFIRYRLGGGAGPTRFPLEHPTGVFSVLVRQPSVRFDVRGLGDPSEVSVEGERFVRFAASDVEPGAGPTLEWEAGSAGLPISPVMAAGLVVGLILLSTGVVAARRRSA